MTRLIAIIAAVLLLPLAARAVMPGLLAVIAADEGSASPDLIVTGTLDPDATGDYFEDGVYAGYTKYSREDDAYALWTISYPPVISHISVTAGTEGDAFFYKLTEGITGAYIAVGTATGTPTVSTP